MPRSPRLLSKDLHDFIRLLRQHEVEFLVCGVPGHLDGIPVAYVAVTDLLKAKREAGRPKDLADLDELMHIHRHP